MTQILQTREFLKTKEAENLIRSNVSWNSTHYEEEFEDNQKVSFRFLLDDACGTSPVVYKEINGEKEEDDICDLQDDKDNVEVKELRTGEERSPLSKESLSFL